MSEKGSSEMRGRRLGIFTGMEEGSALLFVCTMIVDRTTVGSWCALWSRPEGTTTMALAMVNPWIGLWLWLWLHSFMVMELSTA